MTPPLLLDTCAIIWISGGKKVAQEAENAISCTFDSNGSIYISPFSAWELGMLMSRGRLPSSINERAMLERLIALNGVSYAEMNADVLINASYLPGPIHKDPADRIIIATAREYGMTILTRDQKILDYADQGHVNALRC